VQALPPDVAQWFHGVSKNGERLAASLFSDIRQDGSFGESWAFLTNHRLLVLSPNGDPHKPEVRIDIPLEEIDECEVREYVGSEEFVVRGRNRGYEVARFSAGAREEAREMLRHLREFVQARKEDREPNIKNVPMPKRPSHKCAKCGRP